MHSEISVLFNKMRRTRSPGLSRLGGLPGTSGSLSFKQLLTDKTGSGIAEGLGALAVLMILTTTVSTGIVTDMNAVQAISVKAERQAMIASLVGDKSAGVTWGTADAPTTETVTLENGRDVAVTMWRTATPVGASLTAVTAISAGSTAADCTMPADIEKVGCIYATRFHVGDLDSITPSVIIGKAPDTSVPASVIGTVDSRVGTTTSIPQGTVFASGSDSTATVWRYLFTARSSDTAAASGEIKISQAGAILAVIPVDASTGNYFGTFSAAVNDPVTATVSQGNIIVQTVYIYRAGGTS